jgi:hypothetical protein
VVVGLIGLIVLAVVVWLVVRPEPTAERREQQSEPPESVEPETPDEPSTPAEEQFSVTEAPEGPHPRPPELDRESRRELRLLDERLHRQFFEDSELSPQEWARIADELLIVHDNMPVGIVLERFEQATDMQVSAPSRTQKSPREIAALLNEQLSEDDRLELLGTLDEPVEADVYGPRG